MPPPWYARHTTVGPRAHRAMVPWYRSDARPVRAVTARPSRHGPSESSRPVRVVTARPSRHGPVIECTTSLYHVCRSIERARTPPRPYTIHTRHTHARMAMRTYRHHIRTHMASGTWMPVHGMAYRTPHASARLPIASSMATWLHPPSHGFIHGHMVAACATPASGARCCSLTGQTGQRGQTGQTSPASSACAGGVCGR
jgi:hypothetical protein